MLRVTLTLEVVIGHPQLLYIVLPVLPCLQAGVEHAHQVKPHPSTELRLDLHPSLKDVPTELHEVGGLEPPAGKEVTHVQILQLPLLEKTLRGRNQRKSLVKRE